VTKNNKEFMITPMQYKAIVIGAGFGGLSAAGYLAKAGYDVTILEKNNWVGGRAQVWEKAGFRFDMGPSWYLLWEEHEKWFQDMGTIRGKYYEITKLNPQYKAYFGNGAEYTIPGTLPEVHELFESIEAGAGEKLLTYLDECKYKHDMSIENFIYRNYNNLFDIVNSTTVANAGKLNMFASYRSRIRKYFRHPHLQAILEYPTVFLGASARSLPGVYTLMNWVDFGQGAYYPEGGFGKVVESMAKVVQGLGVTIRLNANVTQLILDGNTITQLKVGEELITADIIVSNADYHYVDQYLVPPPYRQYSESHWDKLKLAPSTLNFYIAINKPLIGLEHHTFFFDADWDGNFDDVYTKARLNKKPLFYVHVPSVTDKSTAPIGQTAMFVLIPLASGIEVSEEMVASYLDQVIKRMEQLTKQEIKSHISFYRSYMHKDYEADYNAYKGNAFGLGQTLLQTASFRPPNKSSKISNLYYCGHYSIPGTGTSMAMIGGKVVSERIVADNQS
jgi:phytoene desaturase